MDNLLAKTAELLANAAADPDRVLRWVLIYFGVSSLGFMGVWLIGDCLLYTSPSPRDS